MKKKLRKLLTNPKQFVLESKLYRRAFIAGTELRDMTSKKPVTVESHPGLVLPQMAREVPLIDLSEANGRSLRIGVLSSDRVQLARYLTACSRGGATVSIHGGKQVFQVGSSLVFELDEMLHRHKVVNVDIKRKGARNVRVQVEFWESVPAQPESRVTAGHVVAPRKNDWARRISHHTMEAHGLFTKTDAPVHARELHPARFVGDVGFPIDVVYTWVNHRDPSWQKLYERATGTNLAAEKADHRSADRFISRDELRFSLRSVVEYAPWVRTIYVASNCRAPAWLDLEHPRIRWVSHEEFMPADALPVFNSHAIESCLHHIPDLANHFIYLNDDFFLLKRMQPSDFFLSNGLSKSFLENYGVVNGDVHAHDPDYLNAARNGKKLLEQTFRCSVSSLHRHTPYSLRKDVLAEMESLYPEAFARTARARFRSLEDVSTVSFLYHHYAYITGRAIHDNREVRLVKSAQRDYAQLLKGILRGQDPAQTVCVNDGAGSFEDTRWNEYVEDFLAARFSTPASFERGIDQARALQFNAPRRYMNDVFPARGPSMAKAETPRVETRSSEYTGVDVGGPQLLSQLPLSVTTRSSVQLSEGEPSHSLHSFDAGFDVGGPRLQSPSPLSADLRMRTLPVPVVSASITQASLSQPRAPETLPRREEVLEVKAQSVAQPQLMSGVPSPEPPKRMPQVRQPNSIRSRGEGPVRRSAPAMAGSKRVVFHVGAHKTATSLVQKYLRDQPMQTARHGLRFVSRSDTNELVGWGEHLVDEPMRLRRRLEQEARDDAARLVFLSHENALGHPFVRGVHGLYPETLCNAEALGRALDGFDNQIVLSIRPQADFVESYYTQTVQEGGSDNFPEWLSHVDLAQLSWMPMVKALSDVFGKERVTVIDFRDLKVGQEAFLQHFFDRIKLGAELKPEYAPHRNPSLSWKGLDLALAINTHLATSDERKLVRKFLQKNFSNLDYERPVLLRSEQRAELEARYGDEYEALTREHRLVPPASNGAVKPKNGHAYTANDDEGHDVGPSQQATDYLSESAGLGASFGDANSEQGRRS